MLEKGKVYYYYDLSNNSYISYLAIETATKSSGFITPDSLNFKNISNNYLSKIIEDIEGFRFIIDKEEKLLRVFRFDRVTGGNIKTMNWVYDKIILYIIGILLAFTGIFYRHG